MSFDAAHQVPAAGADTWPEPDVASGAGQRLDGHLPVAVLRRWGDWAEVECSNGWRAWVDGRHLVDLAPARPAPASRGPIDGVDPLAAGGGVAVLAAAFLPWLRGGGESADAFDVVAEVLVSLDAGPGGPKLGVLLLVLGLAAVGVARDGVPGGVRMTVGSALVLIPALYTLQIQRLVQRGSDLPGTPGLLDSLGLGVLVALAGGVAVSVSGWRLVRP